MKQNFLALIPILSLLGVCRAQEPEMIVPPSPATELILKGLNYDVDNSSGVATISIPIYTLEVDGVVIPISLNYNSTGIKHGETPGELGLGWTMSCNYRMSRTVYGRPDESYEMPSGDLFQQGYNISDKYTRDSYFANFVRKDNYEKQLPHVNYTYVDGEYDLFNYFSPSGSGYYFMDDRTTLSTKMINDADNTKIVINDDVGAFPYLRFNVWDSKGAEYLYGNSTTIYESVNPDGVYAYATAWPLMHINTVKGTQIDFSYVMNQSMDKNSNKSQFTVRECSIVNGQLSGTGGSPDLTLGGRYANTSYRDSHTKQLGDLWGFPYQTFNIDKISYDGIEVKFIRSGVRITSIEIWKNQALYEKYDLEYSGSAFGNQQNNLLTKVKKGVDYEYNFEYYPGNGGLTAKTDAYGFNVDANSGSTPLHIELKNDPLDNYTSVENPFELYRITTFNFFERWYRNSSSVPNFFALKKIVYPTKGSTEFVYESNKGTVGRLDGIRLKRVLDYNDHDEIVGSRHYRYGLNEDGNGHYLGYKYGDHLNDFVDQSYEISYYHTWQGYIEADVNSLKTYSTYPLKNDPVVSSLNRVFYPEITIYNEDVHRIAQEIGFYKDMDEVFKPLGKTVFGYQENSYETTDYIMTASTDGNNLHTIGRQYYSIFTVNYQLWKKSPLAYKKIYKSINGLYKLLTEEQYNYANLSGLSYQGLKVAPIFSRTVSEFDLLNQPDSGGYLYDDANYTSNPTLPDYYNILSSFLDYSAYYLKTGAQIMTDKTVTSYFDDEGSLSTTEEYTYNGKYQLSLVKSANSLGEIHFSYTSYPTDYADTSGFIKNMADDNILDLPIEIVSYKESQGQYTIQSGTVYTYYPSFESLLNGVYGLEKGGNMDLSGFKFSNRPMGVLPTTGTDQVFSKDSKYKLNLVINSYDQEGNPKSSIKNGEIKTVYLWSYGHKKMVAYVKNATTSDIISALGTTAYNSLLTSTDNTFIKSALTTLRASLAQSQVYGYIYNPITELLSETIDPKGLIQTYHYDAQHRLEFVKDHNGKVLNKTEYNYKD